MYLTIKNRQILSILVIFAYCLRVKSNHTSAQFKLYHIIITKLKLGLGVTKIFGSKWSLAVGRFCL